ncbi:MAG: Zinc transporter ZupT [Methanonatronarchaeales archaeon]|nr:Zinc transporter ZupT [Methanonatronarchaeales archaeon]
MLWKALLYGGLAGSATLFGTFSVMRFEGAVRRWNHLVVAAAAGVLLGAAFFRLMPAAEELATGVPGVVLVGLLAFYLIENRFVLHLCDEEEGCDIHDIGLMAVMGLGFHSLIDGMAIGAGFRVNEALGVLTALAVILHEYPEGVIAYGLLIAGEERSRVLLYAALVALATPFGAAVTYVFAPALGEEVLGFLLALAAGSFIYVGAADLIPRTHESDHGVNALLVVAGVAAVYLLTSILTHWH